MKEKLFYNKNRWRFLPKNVSSIKQDGCGRGERETAREGDSACRRRRGGGGSANIRMPSEFGIGQLVNGIYVYRK